MAIQGAALLFKMVTILQIKATFYQQKRNGGTLIAFLLPLTANNINKFAALSFPEEDAQGKFCILANVHLSISGMPVTT